MNTHPVLLKLARQGDARAIAALMNDALREQEVWVKAIRDDRCLQVMLKAPRSLDQLTCTEFIRRGMERLQSQAIDHVRTYAWQTYADFPDWVVEIDLLPQAQETLAISESPSSKAAPLARVEQDEADTPSVKITSPDASAKTLDRPQPDAVKFGMVVVLAVMLYFVVTNV